MIFLESPALTAPKAEWEAWQAKLQKMNGRDESVKFARKRAASVLQRYTEREQYHSQQSAVAA